MSKFQYPKLTRPEITAILGQFQIANVSEHDLLKLNQDFVSDLYTRILIHLDALPEEDHEQLEFAALEQLENPDFHVDSVPVMKLYNRIKEVVALVECPRQFTLRDLLTPEADRTEFFLSTILNFCLHREARMNSLTEIIDEVNLLEEQQRDLEAKILQLKSEINECNEAREREVPLVQELDAKVKELRQTIAALNNNQMSLRASFRKLKEKTGEMDEKRAIEERKSAREEAMNAERSAMQTYHEKSAIVEVYTKVHRKMSKHFLQMQAIQEQHIATRLPDLHNS